jgi:ketosteroid isomerase-like protein
VTSTKRALQTPAAVVQAGVEAFERRDADAMWALMDEEFEFRSSFLGGEKAGVYRGLEGVRRYVADIDDAFEDWHPEDQRLVEAGPDRLVFLYRMVGTGRGSGVPIDAPLAIVWTLRDGKLLLGEVFLDQAEALAAAGVQAEASENVRVVGEVLEAWNRQDIDTVLTRVSDDLKWAPATIATLEGRSFRGKDGFREFAREWGETWETFDVDLHEIREEGDVVIVLGHVHASARGSGLELDNPVAYVFQLRDGLLSRGQSFLDHDEALAAAGAHDKETE